jgi:hypothetical protein
MFDGQKAYLIPNDKREEYFEFSDLIKSKVNGVNEENWNTYNDPVVKIDMSFFKQNIVIGIKLFMGRIGAKDVTDMYIEKDELINKN